MTAPVAPVFATVFRNGEWPMVAALADDVARHHPEARLYALALDGQPAGVSPGPITVLLPDDLGITAAQQVLLRFTTTDGDARMATAPVLVAHVLAQGTSGPVVYLAPDTTLLGPLPAIPTTGLTLLPRVRRVRPDDGRTPEPSDLLRLSVFDDGFLAAGADAMAQLAATADRLNEGTLAEDGARAREWDLLATVAPTTVLDEPGVGVAYWNADDHHGPVITMRLPGLDPDAPYLLSRDQGLRPRVLLSERADLQAIVERRLAALAHHGLTTAPDPTRLGGLVVDDAVRAACRQALHDDPAFASTLVTMVSDGSGDALATWLAETAPGSREPRISRYLLGVWAADPYATAAFPNPRDDQSEHLIRWARASSDALGIPSQFLPRATDVADIASAAPAVSPDQLQHGVNLIGFLRAGFGIGEATRLLHEALIDSDIPPTAISVSHDDLEDKVESAADDQSLLYDINLICVNVDWLEMLSRRLGSDLM
ncbi:MAG: hypothetical protein ACOYL4_10225, partial [Miltoncostaeaceae bacterium]